MAEILKHNVIMPLPLQGEALSVDGRCLSVSLSVCPVPDPETRMEERNKLKIGRKEAHDTGDPLSHLKVKRSKVNVIYQVLSSV